ncbi:MAG: hypothetical protein RIE32_00560 [Phycisphaerales bacterium]
MTTYQTTSVAVLASTLLVAACAGQGTKAPPVQRTVETAAAPEPEIAPAPGPRVHLPNPVIDLGTHLDTEVLTTEAVIQNVGDAVLELVYTQPGANFAGGATLVEPGETYRAPVAVDLNRRPGGPNEVKLRWHTNDPENRLMVITLRFHVRPVVDITVTPLDPGR